MDRYEYEIVAAERERIRRAVEELFPVDPYHYIPDYRHGFSDMKKQSPLPRQGR